MKEPYSKYLKYKQKYITAKYIGRNGTITSKERNK